MSGKLQRRELRCARFILFIMWIFIFHFLAQLFKFTFAAASDWQVLCPVECSCNVRPVQVCLLNQSTSMKTVDCSSKGLKRIPRDLPTDAEAIFLQNNSITMHLGISGDHRQVRVLDLSHNAIQGFFGQLSLPQLEHLDIGYNLIRRVSSSDNDFFALLRNLRTLSFRGNGLKMIDEATLDVMPRLAALDLAENILNVLKPATFADLRQLRRLDLFSNNITNFSITTPLELEILNVSKNPLSIFKAPLLKVEILDLSGARFSTLSRDSLVVQRVKNILLRNSSNLWKISSSAFINQNSVERLDLADCQNLIYIEPEAFNNLSIAEIILDNTGLIQVPEDLSNTNLSITNVRLSCQLNTPLVLNSAHSCNWKGQLINKTDLVKIIATQAWNSTPPEILPSFPPNLTADLGSILEIQCQTFGEADKINWIRLDERRKREYPMPSFSGVLRVGPLYRVDSGKYVCRAFNQFGQVNRSVQVNVTYAPVIIIPIVISQQYVTFAWNNSDPSIASQFRVIYFEETNGNFTQIRIIFMDHLVRTYTIGNLKSETTYKFCLFLNKSGNMEEQDCKNMTTKAFEHTGRSFESAYELLIAIGCVSSLLFFIFISTCIYRFYQDKQHDSMSESLSRILLSDTSAINSEATTPVTYFNPAVDPLTPTTDLDIRAAFLPENHPYRNNFDRGTTSGQDVTQTSEL